MAGLPALKALREGRGYTTSTQLRDAMLLEMREPALVPSRGSLENWEKGTVTPRVTEAEIVADFFGVSLDQLAGRKPLPKWAEKGPPEEGPIATARKGPDLGRVPTSPPRSPRAKSR